ncbi:hypothetical protein LXL04_010623 [Taraxacum kok-saghyz]
MSGGIPYVISLKAVSSASSFSRSSAVGGKVPSSAPRACSAGVAILAAVVRTCVGTFGLPPNIMFVPLPAIFVDMVMAYFRPAWATKKEGYNGHGTESHTAKAWMVPVIPESFGYSLNIDWYNDDMAWHAIWLNGLSTTYLNKTNRQTYEAMNMTHPLSITLSKVKIDATRGDEVRLLEMNRDHRSRRSVRRRRRRWMKLLGFADREEEAMRTDEVQLLLDLRRQYQVAMNDGLIELIISKLSSTVVLILTNKSNIFVTVVAVHILRRILKTIYHRHQFPIFTAKHNKYTNTSTKPLYCAVCLHDVDGGQRYRRLPKCLHCFHVNCIDPWLESRSTCPLCRNEIPIHLLPRKEEKEPGFLYLFFYFSMKAIRRRIESNFNKMMLFEATAL